MAAALFDKAAREKGWDWAASSAGTAVSPGSPATFEAETAMQKLSFDVSDHRSQPLSLNLVLDADLILTMGARHRDAVVMLTEEAKSKTHLLTEFAGMGGEIVDPLGRGQPAYDGCARQLWDLICRLDEPLASS